MIGLGVITGLIIATLCSFILLKKHHLEPGKVTDFFPFKDRLTSANTVVIALAAYNLLLGAKVPSSYLVLFAATVTTLYLCYVFMMFVMERSELIIKTFLAGIVLPCYAPFLALPLRVFVVVFGLSLLLFAEKYRTRKYDKHYVSWAEKRAKRLKATYEKLFTNYPTALRPLLLSFMVVEDVARPRAVRWAERRYISSHPKRGVSTGIMQVRSRQPLSDKESAKQGFDILVKLFAKAHLQGLKGNLALEFVAYEYNGSHEYIKFLSYFQETCRRLFAD
ncbi:MAG: hypothetical protein JWO47_1012 [Candidatus Saccharibacteria bacterium]|nr:hypothetical protein [Candidatus Saccharibacteria bacterium]